MRILFIMAACALFVGAPSALSDQQPKNQSLTSTSPSSGTSGGWDDASLEKTQAAADLTAQQSMAKSAHDLLLPTWLQAIISAGGTLLLFVTLAQNRAAIKTAIASVNHSKDSAERQLRAYVAIEQKLIDKPEIGKSVWATVKFKNFGNTPAYESRAFINFRISKSPPAIPDGSEFGRLDGTVESIGPGDSRRMKLNIGKLNRAAIEDVFEERKHIYIYGMIQYKDTFGKTRYTKYRYIYSGHKMFEGTELFGCSGGNELT